MKSLKPIFALVLIATIVPELLTGSTPLSGFFNPVLFGILLIAYGIAVLVIREIAVRKNMNVSGILLLGFAYGILNEGLFSKTITLKDTLPIPQYSNYGTILEMNLPWFAEIGLWHAVCSVLFPILAVHLLFPGESERPWLPKRLTVFFAVVVLFVGSMFFLNDSKVIGTPARLFIFLFGIFIFVMLARSFGKKIPAPNLPKSASLKPVWLGLSSFFFFLILTTIAKQRLSLFLFFAIYIFGIWFYHYLIKKKQWISQKNIFLFAIGVYMQTTLLGAVFAASLPETFFERVVVGILAEFIFIWIAIRIVTKSNVIVSQKF